LKSADPLVSIIIPVFNRFDLAFRAINSVLSQTHTNWELFIIDDCSESVFELSEDIVKQMDTRPIKVFRNETNQGPGRSRQTGLNNARGEYVCFLDSDDYYHPDFLKKSINVHQKYSEIGATYTTSKYIQTNEIRKNSDQTYKYLMPTLFEKKRPWPTCALLWKKDCTASWKELRSNQDSLFEIDCSFINNRIQHIPEILCFIDKGTGQNTKDLVKDTASNLHRNYVTIYALKNWKKIRVENKDQQQLKEIIIKRVIYVSSKLAGNGIGLPILNNSLQLFPLNWRIAVSLMLLSFMVFIPSGRIRNLSKRTIAALNH